MLFRSVFDAEASDDLTEAGLEIDRLSHAMDADIHWVKDVYGKLETAGQTPVSRPLAARSEERRVGKECRSRWSPYH